ncbi:MAG: exodeoxyribonuclease V subunit beta, partial [Proteobacteria bacterium]
MNGSDDSSPALLEWPLDRTLLIEASAGTGKTWTITALYVRQIVEAGIPVENVLVVTYTEAATKELRSRIRERLVTLREALDSGGIDDPFCLDMLAGIDDGIAARRALDRAISGFDEAAIYTIHGFCQRVLSESAFESATSLDAEVLTSEQDLRQEICDDFWRHEVLRQPRPVVEQLVADNATPETLGGWIDDSASRSWVEVIEPGPAACADYESLASQFEDAFETVRRLWQAHREEVSELLLDSKALNRNAYRLASVHAWLDAMDGMLKNRGLRRPLFDHFDRFTRDRLARSVNNGQQPPRHAFFDACTALEELRRQMDDAMAGRVALLKARLREYVMSELASRKAARRLHSFDDLLALVQGALDGPAGKRLARKLRERYPVAMIDEFQDTDPVQLEIFRRIYDAPGASRIFVGDPKQSIYSFRGADLFAYLAGRELATRRETLARNYRSDPALVRAVNALFTRLDNPFVFDMLEYPEIEGVGTNTARLRVDGKAEARLQFRFLERERFDVRGKTIGKGRASLAICRDVANRIGALLAPEGGDVTLDGRPLSGGDIAVLVRTHDQARQIHEILTQAGVPSVRQGAGSVFASAEAEAVEQVLRAVSEPGRERPLRAALVSDIIGMNADELVAAAASADRWEGIVEQFREY